MEREALVERMVLAGINARRKLVNAPQLERLPQENEVEAAAMRAALLAAEPVIAAELAALRAENARLREALEAILSPDDLLNASPELFGGYAARRMQEQARAALHPKEETP